MKSTLELQAWVDTLDRDQIVKRLGEIILDWPVYPFRPETGLRNQEAVQVRMRLQDNAAAFEDAHNWLHRTVTTWPDLASKWLES